MEVCNKKEVAFRVHSTLEMLMMMELDVLDESQQGVSSVLLGLIDQDTWCPTPKW